MTGDQRRVGRVEREIQSCIASYLISGFRYKLPGLVTIARVQMPADLRSAKVYVSVLGSDQDRIEVLKVLSERAFEVQSYIGQQLRMRYCPKLRFLEDDSTEKMLKVERILQDLRESKIEEKTKLSSKHPTEHTEEN